MILHIVHHYIPYNKINAKNHKQYITYYISDFKQKMTQIWPKRAIFEFSQKMRNVIFFRLQRLGLVQKISNF